MKSSRRSESWHVGRDENGKSKCGPRGGGGAGGKGRSVGRRFHFVSLPACGGAIAAALCQTVTLSRHPFYYLARGCPAPLSIRSPLCTLRGYNVDQAEGCLTACRTSFLIQPSLPRVPSTFLFIVISRFLRLGSLSEREATKPTPSSRREQEGSRDKIVPPSEGVRISA